ncbi:MAG: ABC transporter ATP-binding protein [Firmicutes bacterium]|nr:ABC transporter ATP-binding protein [Bacillota bacterium]MDY2819050.1 ABC transporter ATP-binding protein [Hominisplanchenecus sp.]
MIRIKNLTKDYGKNRGIFDLSFEVQNGEAFGLLGPEGAGKTTVLQLLMGFADASSGRCFIHGKNCWRQSDNIKCFTGYLPEQVSMPAYLTGLSFLHFLSEMRGIKSLEKALNTAKRFELDLDKRIDRMNAEEKKKLAISGALMHDPEILLLDEPSRHLDSAMQNRLFELLLEEKSHGKTILLCSHRFEEAERICDRVGMLKRGMLVNVDDISSVRKAIRKIFRVSFSDEQEAVKFVRKESFEVQSMNGAQLMVAVSGSLRPFLQALSEYEVLELENVAQSLEKLFEHLYGGDLYA